MQRSTRRPAARRHSREVYLRRRLLVLTAAIALILAIVFATNGSSSGHKGSASPSGGSASKKSAGPAHLVVSLASWQLPSPLSRAVALPVDGYIDLMGGLGGSGNSTTPSIVQIDPSTGHSQQVGALPTPVHDAAGAAIGSHFYVFGGGSSSLTADVQSYTPNTAAGTPATAVAGQLPSQRADLAAATAPNGTVYIAGGYNGTTFSPDVLSTKDGTHFNVVATLPTPVRYPAVTVEGGKLWVIGGETAGSSETDAIQTVDLKTGSAAVAGHLPSTLSHASASTLDGKVLVFGGRSAGNVVDTIWSITPGTATATRVGSIPLPLSDMAVASLGESVYLLGGEGQLTQPGTSVIEARMVSGSPPPAPGTAAAPFSGKLLIADRGNNRLLLVDAAKRIYWTFPDATHPAPAQGFYFPDDAFFVKHGTAIITNEEDQNTILEIAYPSGQVIASYGHPDVPGSSPGYLNQPDDAYLLKDGSVTVADAKNCRILFLNPNFTYRSAIGHTGACHHDIPADVAYPNGDTPLADGNFLVSEIYGSYVDEVTEAGQVVWSLKLPIAYPSDPQQLGPDLYLVADYSRPGGLYEFTREGRIVWSYRVPSGEGMLDHPSLAERLPSGLICVNDDYRHRVVIINPANNQIVWQYGDTDTAGTAPGLLKIPDGFDLLAPDGTSPTHPQTG